MMGIDVDGVMMFPLSEEDRASEISHLLTATTAMNVWLKNLKEPEDIEGELIKCIGSFEYWVEHYGFTFDPRKVGQACHQRFLLYKFQKVAAEQIIHAIRNQEDVFLEKSRDMGASWLMCAIIIWMWLFDESFHALVGSRKEDLVDAGTIDDLFGKMDYLLERLPEWMLHGYKKEKHRKRMTMKHPATGNLITGESANASFGRGPRKNLVYLDEYAFWEEDRAVWTGIADTAPCRIVTSTPCGEANMYAKLRSSIPLRITLHWTQHPYKDWAWYEGAKAKRKGDLVSIAQELDIDYQASSGALVLGLLMEQRKKRIIIPGMRPSGDHTGCKFYGGLDWGSTNPAALNIYRVQKDSRGRVHIDAVWEYYEPTTLKKLAEAINTCPWKPLIEDIYADPSMWYYNQNTKDGVTSLAFLLRDLYALRLSPGTKGDTLALEHLRDMWDDPEDIRFRIGENCPNLYRELAGLRRVTSTPFMERKRNTPEALVDKDNHTFDALKYFLNSYLSLNVDKPAEAPPTQLMGYTALRHELSGLKDKILKGHQKERRRSFR